MLPCPHCGYENRDGALLCNLCGTIFRRGPRRPRGGEEGRGGGTRPPGGELPPSLPGPRPDFWSEQRRNRLQALLLVAGVAGILLLAGAVFGAYYGDWRVGMVAAAAVAGVLTLTAWLQGGRIVLALSGAREIAPGELQVLRNVTEEMAIAAGLPPPRLYLIEDSAPNAFATGRDPSRAVVCVTRGLVEKLDRDELQGVISHEMSHIRNSDVLYMTMVGVLVGSVALLSDGFLRTARFGSGSSGRGRGRGSGGAGAIVLLALLLAILAPVVAWLLQMAVSRRREFLADASGVEMTRNPAGLANALEKIQADREALEAANRATQHLYIVNPIKEFGMRSRALFSTHPPTEARVRLLRAMAA